METVGLGFFFEDLPVGRQFKTIGRTVTDADITNFINCTGMVEVLFTNAEFLKSESDIKGRVAPGSLVYSFAEGLLVQATMQHTGFAFLGMELKIEGPVFSGDTVHVECERMAQVEEALRAGADALLLDNMSPDEVRSCMQLVSDQAAGGQRRPLVEASGGITLETIDRYATTGVDLVSVGSLTNSAPVLDLGLDFEPARDGPIR